jgi:hypothetical protein
MNTIFRKVGLDCTGKLTEMLRRIDCNPQMTRKARESAYDWNFMTDDQYVTPLSDQLMENDFDFDESQEENLRTTVRELLANARRAMTEVNVRGQESYPRDRYITLTTFVGNNGAVVYLRDEGNGFDHKQEVSQKKLLTSIVVAHGGSEPSWSSLNQGLTNGGTGIYSLIQQGNFCYNVAGNEVAFCLELDKL